MSMQEASTGVALWRQVADGIERGIADGTFVAGEKLPGETDIAATYRVNRHTAALPHGILRNRRRGRQRAARSVDRGLARYRHPRAGTCARLESRRTADPDRGTAAR